MDSLPFCDIDVLIVVNWLHGHKPEAVYEMFHDCIAKATVFVIDIVTEIDGGKSMKEAIYTHDVSYLSGNMHREIVESLDYPVQFTVGKMKRHIEYWEQSNADVVSLDNTGSL